MRPSNLLETENAQVYLSLILIAYRLYHFTFLHVAIAEDEHVSEGTEYSAMCCI